MIIDVHLVLGVRFDGEHVVTHSVVMRVKSKTIRYIETHHRSDRVPN